MTTQPASIVPAAPAPGPDPEAALWDAYRRAPCPAAREALFEAYSQFARRIARRVYANRFGGDIELQELSQLAFTGLLEAIDRFEPARGIPFRAYAVRRVRGSILDGIARSSELREQLSFRRRMRQDRLRSLTGPDEPDAGDPLQAIADLAVGLALGFMLEGTALYRAERDADPRPTAYQSLAWQEVVGRMMRELGDLPDRQRAILQRHYIDGLSFAQVACMLDLSKGRVSQLHRAALQTLRKRLAMAGHIFNQ